jgi:1-aminocyclopropane-1-carboxylate deaminase
MLPAYQPIILGTKINYFRNDSNLFMRSFLTSGTIPTDDISSLYNKRIKAAVLRLDKIDPVISGNKWFKLRYYLEDAKNKRKKNIITFGGAWSNHILATAAACNKEGLHCTGIIRGEQPVEFSPTLLQAKAWGMELVFVSRSDYRDHFIPEGMLDPESYVIKEGGYGEPGARGASTILQCCQEKYTHYCCAAGTGTMTAGLINALSPAQKLISISVMKNNRELENKISALLTRKNQDPNISPQWQVFHDYHFDGYAKYQPGLLQFMNDFYRQSSIPTDFVYTGKLFYAIADLIQKDFFEAGSNILLIHSGGLQGNASLRKGTLIF